MPDDDEDLMPAEPMSEMAEGAAQLHELFESYVRAGFRRPEALYIVGIVISTGMSNTDRGPFE